MFTIKKPKMLMNVTVHHIIISPLLQTKIIVKGYPSGLGEGGGGCRYNFYSMVLVLVRYWLKSRAGLIGYRF